MSWFFGYIGANPVAFKNTFHSKAKLKTSSYLEKDTCLFYDDNKNCRHNLNSSITSGTKFLISGTGITQGEKKKILNENDWNELFDKEERILQIDGHFAGVIISGFQFKLITNPIGLRDIYYTNFYQEGIIFSTRIELLLKFVNAEINYGVFGGRWLLYNQVSHKSIFKNVDRIVCGSSVTIDRRTGELTKKDFNWIPKMIGESYSESHFENELASLVNIYSEGISGKSLMLSGGLDSRVLLSLLINNNAAPFSIYTFGNNGHPDLMVAKRITSHCRLAHSIIDQNDFSPKDFWEELKNYSTQSLVNNSVTSFLHFKSYDAFKQLDGIVIDGGFGEIWRREFLYRLSLKGKNDIVAHDSKKILSHLKLYRTDIFNPDIVEEMENGCLEQINEVFELLPSTEQIGIENWLDLLAIKTRIPNYYLHEQSLHDSILTSIMPFAQQSLLNNLFRIDLNQRKNGKLFRKIIRRNNKALAGFPLVKGEVILPFHITSFQSRLISLLLKKAGAGKNYRSQRLENLKKLKPLMLELLNDKSVTGTQLYDKRKLDEFERLITHDDNDVKRWNEIDWWLAFESFRQSINLD